MVNGKPSKTLSPLQATGHYGVFVPSGTGLLEYSFRASPGGTHGSGHSSHQQAGGYSGKRNKRGASHFNQSKAAQMGSFYIERKKSWDSRHYAK
jgi:hypothetical protein